MLSVFKTGQAADSVPAEKIQVTYRRYRMQALLSVFLGILHTISCVIISPYQRLILKSN